MAPTQELNLGIEAAQEHPDQIASPEAPESKYGPRNENLPQQLVDAIKCAVREFQEQEKFIRRREVMRDRRNRFYERGYQHIYENQRTGIFTQAQAGAIVNVNGQSVQCPNYIDDYNIFQPYLRILEAILTQNPPGIDFRPINPNAPEDNEAADTGEGYRKIFDRANKVKSIQTQIVRMMGLSARTVLWTRTEANAQKFGFDGDGKPKQMETTSVYGTLESRVSILAKSQEDTLFCILFDDIDTKQGKAEYPHIADKIRPNVSGIGESAYERMARLGALQGTGALAQFGDAFSHLVTREHCWLRPAAFTGEKYEEAFSDAGEQLNPDNSPITVRQVLNALFPLGCHAVFVGDEYAGSWAESMDDAIVIGFPYEGDGMYRLALMDPMVVVQDCFNDSMNASREVWDMGWPSTWVNAGDTEYDAIVDQKADPYAIRQMKLKTGEKMGDQFFREPNPELPATFVQFMELLQGPLPQFMIAAPPALFGASMEDQKTASGYAQARAQAMGQQGLIWQQMQDMMARMYYQAALAAAKNPCHSEEMVIPAENGGTATVRLDRLTKGKFGAYPDEDSSFPESTSQKRGALQNILTMALQSPQLGVQIMESPDNWKTFATIYGFPELHIPESESRDKQVFEIEQLLMGAPIPPDPAVVEQLQASHAAATLLASQGAGQAPPPLDLDSLLTPSVPVQPLDYHLWEFQEGRQWLSSGECRRQLAEGNDRGVRNVILHVMEHAKFLPPDVVTGTPGQTAPAAPVLPVKKPPVAAPPPEPVVPVQSAASM